MHARRFLALLSFLALPIAPLRAGAAEPVQSIGAGVAAAVVPVSFSFVTREEGHELLLTDVHVVIHCAVGGKVFEGVSEGPFLVAGVPDGRYEVVASHEGRPQRVAFTVARGEPHRVFLTW